jgi:hypothetical protein
MSTLTYNMTPASAPQEATKITARPKLVRTSFLP